MSTRLYRDTEVLRRTVSQAKVETLVSIDQGAPAGSYRKITVFGPATELILALDTVTEEQIDQEVSAGAEIGEGLTQVEWPAVGTSVPWSMRIGASQRLRAMLGPGALTGVFPLTVIVEHRAPLEV